VVRKTEAGSEASICELTARAYLAVLLSQISLRARIEEAGDDAVLSALAAFSSAEKFLCKDKNHIWSER